MGTRIGQAAQELARTNQWWRTATWAESDRDLQAARESGLGYRPACLDALQSGGLYLLRGPRRVGKTVSVKLAIHELITGGVAPQAVIRIAADGWTANDLRTAVQNIALPPLPPDSHRWWFIDEVTATVGDWATQVKWLRDNDPAFGDATVVLTGSNAEGLTAAAGVLAGRRGRVSRTDRTLLPMGFRTFCSLLRPELADLPQLGLHQLRTGDGRDAYHATLPWLDDLVQMWELYLTYGGFPPSAAAARAGRPIPDWFVEDLFSVIQRDAFAGSRLGESQTGALVSRFWQSMTSPVSLNKIGAELGLTQEVVVRHLRYLRDAHLLWDCPQKSHQAFLPRERAQRKVYAIDPLVARLAHLRNPERPDIDPTQLAEMQIGMALRRAVLAAGRPWNADEPLYYQRTPARKEIDFVGESLAGAAVEGKYVETGRWRRDAATLEASPWRGILTTRNVLDCSHDDGAWAVPAGIIAALVDT